MPLSLLVVSSETLQQQEKRRIRSGEASHETYAVTLKEMAADSVISTFCCVDGSTAPSTDDLQNYSGIIFAGSPILMHEDTPEVTAAARFMQDVFGSGTPSFGSCAGLQIAAVTAGGKVEPLAGSMAAGFARGIIKSDGGRKHPLLNGRPLAWDAPTMHSAIVTALPEGAKCLASSNKVPVEAAEIHSGQGTFWGVQYHPELALKEIGEALVGQAQTLVEKGLVESEEVLKQYKHDLAALDKNPEARDISWKLGLDEEVTDIERRRVEIANFLQLVAK